MIYASHIIFIVSLAYIVYLEKELILITYPLYLGALQYLH